VALGKATTYAYQRGVTVVRGPRNNATDLDHTATRSIAECRTRDRRLGTGRSVLPPARRITTGRRRTRTSASRCRLRSAAGDFALLATRVRVAAHPAARSCSSVGCLTWSWRHARQRREQRDYCWAAGTSMASPRSPGCRLIIGRFAASAGGRRRKLRASADDLGKPGTTTSTVEDESTRSGQFSSALTRR